MDLREYIIAMVMKLPDGNLLIERSKDKSLVYPFNTDLNYLLTALVGRKIISFEEYEQLVFDYSQQNQNLKLYEITAPRRFGEAIAEQIIVDATEHLEKASKKTRDGFSGQYDLFYPGTNYFEEDFNIEVKASRASDSQSDEPLYKKAISSSSNKDFFMNFGQVKPKDSDVFVILGVWSDTMRFWVLASHEVANHKYYSKGQHRYNKGNEGQFSFKKNTIEHFSEYECSKEELETKIIEAYKRQKKYCSS